MVVYTKQEETLLHKCYVGVCPVTDHKFPTTLAFLIMLMQRIKLAVPDLKHLHLVTDSPTSQYRNRYSCGMLVRAREQFGIRITWNWLESGHGKGLCDGVGGALKGLADRVVKADGAIQSAEEFVEKITPQTQKVTLLYASKESVLECDALVTSWKCHGVDGITKQHQATVHDEQLYLRETSCYEECCFVGDDLHPTCASWTKAKSIPSKPTVPGNRPTARRCRKTATATSKATSDLDSDSDSDDEIGANEAALLEQQFSSDDDVPEAAERIQRTRRVRARERKTRKTASRALPASTSTAEQDSTPPPPLAAETAAATVQSAVDNDDPDYAPPGLETPRERARSARLKAKAAEQARRRRQGDTVNELADDEGDSTDDEWPLSYQMSISSMQRHGY